MYLFTIIFALTIKSSIIIKSKLTHISKYYYAYIKCT